MKIEDVNDHSWLTAGTHCRLQLAIGPKDTAPKDFVTRVVKEGKRVGDTAVIARKFCKEGCHTEVEFVDRRFGAMTVETEDLLPLAEA